MTVKSTDCIAKPIVRIDEVHERVLGKKGEYFVRFDAHVKFPEGRFVVSQNTYTREDAVRTAKLIIRRHKPHKPSPQRYPRGLEVRAEHWKPDENCVSSEYLEI